MRLLKFCCLLSVIFFSLLAAAQPTAQIKGQVTKEREQLAGATISLKGTTSTVISDSTGAFSIPNLAKGRYLLQVSMIGFETFQKSIEVKEGEVKEIAIELKPTESTLNEVVVSGTLKPVQRLQSPIAVEVFTPQFFKKNPSPSIFESLQMVNGVRPQINCSVCNTGDIHINGLEGP